MAITNLDDAQPRLEHYIEHGGKNMVKRESVDLGSWARALEIPDLTDSSNDESDEGPSQGAKLQDEPAVEDRFKQLLINDSNAERQTVMKFIVRIVANMLISKFPIDECCNNRNNLMVNNLIGFLERVLGRSRVPLNQFLVACMYVFRCSSKMQGALLRNNNGKTCLRRLVITSLALSSMHFGTHSAAARANLVRSAKQVSIKLRILNQHMNTHVWAVISGLREADLERMVRQLKETLDNDLRVSSPGLARFKNEIGVLVKLVISRDVAH